MAMSNYSPYDYGARKGVYLGVIFCLLFLCSVGSMRFPALSLLSVLLFVSVPFAAYHAIRRYCRVLYFYHSGTMPGITTPWLCGIVMFGCASLLLALVSVVYMKWVNPTFLLDSVNGAIEFYSSMPGESPAQVAEVLTRMIEANALPTASSVAMEMIWLSVLSGSLVSLVASAIACARPIPPELDGRPEL